MQWSRQTSLVISILAGLALAGLLVTQYRWLQEGIALHQRLFEDKMTVLRHDIFDQSRKRSDLIGAAIAQVEGQMTMFAGREELRDLEHFLEQTVDSVLQRHDVPVPYTLHGKVTDGPCLLMHEQRDQHYPSPRLMAAKHWVCLCPYAFSGGSLDFVIETTAPPLFNRSFAGLLLPALGFIVLLVLLFAYVIRVIYRQKRVAELKNDFINNLTHEFKTPIFTIGLTARMLGRSRSIQEQERLMEYVNLIERENQRLRNHVDKVLQTAVIDAGSLTLEREKVDLHALLRQVIDTFEIAVQARNGQIECRMEAEDPTVRGDASHLSNVLFNLVDNAYKYSPKQPHILIATISRGDKVQLRIQDNGIGMSAEVKDRVFEKFYRAQRGDRHDVKGFGLGLSYVKSIIDRHGGHISVDSAPGRGTTIVLELNKRI